MIEEKYLQNNTLFLGDRSVIFVDVKKSLIKKYGEDKINFFEIEKLNISIEDARTAIDFESKTNEGTKVIMLSSFYWGVPIQNSLLKILEESADNTFIYLFGLSENVFLPTILSRVQKANLQKANKYMDIALEVLSLPPNERPQNKKVIKILSKKTIDTNYQKDTESEKKDRESHILFLQAIMGVVLQNKSKVTKPLLEKLLKISVVANEEGGSPHLFIDWLLLSTPQL